MVERGTRLDVTLPAGAEPVDLVTGGDLAWVFDVAGLVYLYDADGVLLATHLLPNGLREGSRVASALGAFYVDGDGEVERLAADGTVTELGILAGTLVAADDRWLYVAEEPAVAEGFARYHALVARDPATLSEVGSMPTWRAPTAIGGEPMVVLEQDLLVLERP